MSLDSILQAKEQGLLEAIKPGIAGGAGDEAAALRIEDRSRPLTIVIVLRLNGQPEHLVPNGLRASSCDVPASLFGH